MIRDGNHSIIQSLKNCIGNNKANLIEWVMVGRHIWTKIRTPPPTTETVTESGNSSINWKRFGLLNILWVTFLGVTTYGIFYWNYIQTQNQLPRRYASYDQELEIQPVSVVLIFVIMIVIPNILFLLLVYSRKQTKQCDRGITNGWTCGLEMVW